MYGGHIAVQQPKETRNWFFVDESGDPTFYDKKGNFIVGQEGCSPIHTTGTIVKTPLIREKSPLWR